MKGFIYILENEAMPGLYKIGYSEDNPERRIKEISRATGVPGSFEFYGKYEIDTPHFSTIAELEKWLHKIFDRERYSDNREFFRVLPSRVRHIIEPFTKKHNHSEEVELTAPSPLTHQSNQKKASGRKNLYEEAGLKKGDILSYFNVEDRKDEKIYAKVISESGVKLFDSDGKEIDEVFTISGSIRGVKEYFLGKVYKNSESWRDYWKFNGERLRKVVERIEENKNGKEREEIIKGI